MRRLVCLLIGHHFGDPTNADWWNASQKCSRCPYRRHATITRIPQETP